MHIKKHQKDILAICHQLLEKGMASRSWGNVSVRISANKMLITPSGRLYVNLRPGEMVIVDLRDLRSEGPLLPSSEYGLHAEIYNQRTDIEAVIHTHQPYASILAAARVELPPVLDDMAQIIGPSVRVAEYFPSHSLEFALAVTKTLQGRKAALMANHGAICIGRNLDEAMSCCLILEKACMVFLGAQAIGGAHIINPDEAMKLHQEYLESYSKLAENNKLPPV